MNFTNIIGLTGLFCSGKSTFEKIINEEFNYFIIDLDKIGHIALNEKKDDITKVFGEKIITNDNNIDRKKLGEIVFKDRKMLDKLNKIVWPFMKNYVEDKIKDLNNKKVCISGAVLFEIGLDNVCSKIFVVKSNLFNILKRAKNRNNYPICKTLSIISKQKVLKIAKKKAKNSEIIYVNNNSSIEDLKAIIKTKIEG